MIRRRFVHYSRLTERYKAMTKRECPSCAMMVDEKSEECPVCRYEFPQKSKPRSLVAILLLIIFLLVSLGAVIRLFL